MTTHATERSTRELVGELGVEVRRLVRDELQLTAHEAGGKAKWVVLAAAAGGGAGVVAALGVAAALVALAVVLALYLQAWAAVAITALVAFCCAGLAALIARAALRKATPLISAQRLDSVKQDLAALKGNGDHE